MNLPPITRTFAGRVVDRLGIDRSVGYLLAARICQIGFYGLAMVMIVRHLSPEEQGFYYTFLSLLSLQGFVDLGLAIVIINTASHEWPRLRAAHDRRIEGDPEAPARRMPDYLVILAWVHAERIIRSNPNYLEKGGRFVVLCPETRVLGKEDNVGELL